MSAPPELAREVTDGQRTHETESGLVWTTPLRLASEQETVIGRCRIGAATENQPGIAGPYTAKEG